MVATRLIDLLVLGLELMQQVGARQRGFKLTGLQLVGGKGVEDFAIIGMIGLARPRGLRRLARFAGIVQRHPGHVGEPRRLPAPACAAFAQTFRPPPRFVSGAPARARARAATAPNLGFASRALRSVASAALSCPCERRSSARVIGAGTKVGSISMAFSRAASASSTLAPREVEIGQIDLRLRPLCIKSLSRNILIEGGLEALAILGIEVLLGLASERRAPRPFARCGPHRQAAAPAVSDAPVDRHLRAHATAAMRTFASGSFSACAMTASDFGDRKCPRRATALARAIVDCDVSSTILSQCRLARQAPRGPPGRRLRRSPGSRVLATDTSS